MPNDIDRLQNQCDELFRQLGLVSLKMPDIEKKLAATMGLTTIDRARPPTPIEQAICALDERIDNLEKHCGEMQVRLNPQASASSGDPPKIDPSRIYYTRHGMKVTDLNRGSAGRLWGDLGSMRHVWQAEVKFKTRTVEHGVIELQKWPEGFVLWCGGVVQWRSFK